MKGSNATYHVEKGQMPANDTTREAAKLFSNLSPEAQKKIIDLIKSLLSKR